MNASKYASSADGGWGQIEGGSARRRNESHALSIAIQGILRVLRHRWRTMSTSSLAINIVVVRRNEYGTSREAMAVSWHAGCHRPGSSPPAYGPCIVPTAPPLVIKLCPSSPLLTSSTCGDLVGRLTACDGRFPPVFKHRFVLLRCQLQHVFASRRLASLWHGASTWDFAPAARPYALCFV